MSINGIGAGIGNSGITPGRIHTPEREADTQEVRQPRPTSLPPEARPAKRGPRSEAPPGTDPVLWSVLTTEERAFFAKAQAIGPLTYGPRARAGDRAAPAHGGRIDVRV